MAVQYFKAKNRYEGYLLTAENIEEAAAWCGGTVVEDEGDPVAIDLTGTRYDGYVQAGIGDYLTKDLYGVFQAWIASDFLPYNEVASYYGASPVFEGPPANPGTDATFKGSDALSGNNNGGNAILEGGAKAGTGLPGHAELKGQVVIDQGAPVAKTTDVTLTIADLLGKIITGTHTAGATQTYTLPTGALCDAGVQMDVDKAFEWCLMNESAAAADTITVAAGEGHTIVGNPIVQSRHSSTGGIYGSSAQFRTRKTAANTFVTYRIA